MEVLKKPLLFLMITVLLVCACSNDDSTDSDDSLFYNIPHYPNAVKTEDMGQSMGVVNVDLEQYTTSDPYENVMDFFTDELEGYDTKVQTYTTEMGRQTAIDVTQKQGDITIAIQEFKEEGGINITFMGGNIDWEQ